MRRLFLVAIAFILAACGALPGASGSPTPSGSPLSQVELKYRLLAQVGPIAYCDPDSYPVGRPVTPAYVQQRLSSIQANDSLTYQAILAHHGLSGTLTQSQQLTVYTDYKQLAALRLVSTENGFAFDYFVNQGPNAQSVRTKGSIDTNGAISVTSRTPESFACPICLYAGTLIDTPSGTRPVSRLRVGMLVWTVSTDGTREAQPVLRIVSMPGGPGFVVHLVLADGRDLWVSPNHPLADGRRAGELVRGDTVDGSPVTRADLLPSSAATYDLLPAGPTATYWANGILLASTLSSSAFAH